MFARIQIIVVAEPSGRKLFHGWVRTEDEGESLCRLLDSFWSNAIKAGLVQEKLRFEVEFVPEADQPPGPSPK